MKKILTIAALAAAFVLVGAPSAHATPPHSNENPPGATAEYIVGEYVDSTNTYSITNTSDRPTNVVVSIWDASMRTYVDTIIFTDVQPGQTVVAETARDWDNKASITVNGGYFSIEASDYDSLPDGTYYNIKTGKVSKTLR